MYFQIVSNSFFPDASDTAPVEAGSFEEVFGLKQGVNE
jgi:hypothetical protein